MSDSKPAPSFVRLEKAALARDFPAAVKEIIAILDGLQGGKGSFNGMEMGTAFHEGGRSEVCRHLATRFAAAFGDVITAPEVKIDSTQVEALFVLQRWTDMLFRLSGFQTSDYLLARLPHDANGQLALNESTLINFLLAYSPASPIGINLDACFKINGLATLVASIGWLAARNCVAPEAVALRDRLLEWLPGKLAGLNLGGMQLTFAADSYMHCSYAFSPHKHRIKADFIAQFRKALLREGAQEMSEPPPPRERPRVVVVCEHFHSRHSVFRTHSRAVRSLKDGFEVIGFGFGDRVDEPARACFDSFESYPDLPVIPSAKETAERILALQPDMVFFLGVGMSSLVIALASLRLAPVQCVSYGHTATTMSPAIDYMILPDDFVGADNVYSETLLRFPPQAIPYSPPVAEEPAPPPRVERKREGPLRIAVPASVMKINGPFLKALADAAERSSHEVRYYFFPLAATGVAFFHIEQEIKRILPQSVVFHESDRQTYLQRLGACEFFVSPFPYGNMNSIVDAAVMGIPGVCLDGAEAHSHADLAIFRRLGLPEELCTKSVEEYVAAIARLIDDADWRAQCQKIAEEIDLYETMYKGDETLFCAEMLKLLKVGVES
jgi:hypothetical protein